MHIFLSHSPSLGRSSRCRKVKLASDFLLAWRAIANGVTHQTSQGRNKYWSKWCSYVSSCNASPSLAEKPPLQQAIILTGFDQRVRSGAYGRGDKIKVQSINQALAAITATLELGGQQSPALQSEGNYITPLHQQLEGLRREDPPSIPQLAVPVSLVKHITNHHGASSQPIQTATAELISIAFFYLLRVGEYTTPRKVKVNGKWQRATRTRQFRVQDVGFFKDGQVLPRSSLLEILLSADSVTLKISNQKNGRMGQTIHQESTGPQGAVACLARRVHHILYHGGSDSRLICDVMVKEQWHSVTRQGIVTLIQQGAKDLKLDQRGIDPDLLGSHSLRAGGAMALKLQHYADTLIQKLGRWSSTTWLQYIHAQIAHLSKGVAAKMSEDLPFYNIAFIEAPSSTSPPS